MRYVDFPDSLQELVSDLFIALSKKAMKSRKVAGNPIFVCTSKTIVKRANSTSL
jgi:hypothetical protein